MHVVYANCFGAPAGDLLVTDETTVAAAVPAGCEVVVADALIDPDRAQELNARLWELAFDWSRLAGEDPTTVNGISAADLAGGEALQGILMAAGRGLLEAEAFLAARPAAPERLTVVTPQPDPAVGPRAGLAAGLSDAGYLRYERLQGAAFAVTVAARSVTPVTVDHVTVVDARNAALVAKYYYTRDPPMLPSAHQPGRRPVAAASALVNLVATARRANRRPRLLVHEYNPTAAFVRRRPADVALVRTGFGRDALPAMMARGDRALPLPPGGVGAQDRAVAAALEAFAATHDAALRSAFSVDGIDLWALVGDDLRALSAEYAAWARAAAPVVRRAIRRGNVTGVLVPFDIPPPSRLAVRVAQAAGLPTFVLNDGWKGDDFSRQGMTADVPLVTAAGVLRDYFARHPNAGRAVLTGDPRADEAPPRRFAQGSGRPLRTILIGSFTFSPIDLNCRRSDPERFLTACLTAIRASEAARDARIVVKLHPADFVKPYEELLRDFPELDVDVRSGGDVVDLFGDADLYVTTYSTSLMQAAAAGVPFVYLAVNPQRLHAPFDASDPIMGNRLAHDADGLRALLDDPRTRTLPPGATTLRWIEDSVGPTDGQCTARVLAALRDAGALA